MFHVINKYRQRAGQLMSTDGDGNNGMFIVPHNKIQDYYFACMASDGLGWEHVSVSLLKSVKRQHGGSFFVAVERTATWAEMSYIKSLFWDAEDAVMELHPPKSMYVSSHPYCLHLWRPVEGNIPLPDPIMVGIPGDNIQSF